MADAPFLDQPQRSAGLPISKRSRQNAATSRLSERQVLLPPHQRDFITRVPVTPGVALGTYHHRPSISDGEDHRPFTSDYFGQLDEESVEESSLLAVSDADDDDDDDDDGIVNPTRYRNVELSGNLISATFTLPHALRYRHGADWELKRRYHQSAHLDSLSYLSSKESPWDHTIVAWTGEITNPEDSSESSLSESACAAPTSTSIALGGYSPLKDTSKPDDVLITSDGKSSLERELHNNDLKTIPIWLADESDKTEKGIRLRNQARWRRYAEHDLCALFHYRQHPPTDGGKDEARWRDFQHMNEAFADKICEIYKPGDVVMVHDYYLILLPRILRLRKPDMFISFFLHSPFPTSELVRCLSRRKEILEGPLGANLVAFQAFHYAQHFATCCTRILGYPANMDIVMTPEARVHIDVSPVGIDTTKITSLAWAESVNEKCATLRKLHEGKKIIVGCDPLDRLGGVDKKMMAFEKFLDRYPEWQGKVVLLQITSPTTIKDDDGEEARFSSQVNELVNQVNTTFGSLDFIPVQSYSQCLTEDEYFALLRSGDIALITSVRDGMSTTGLEYIVCQRENHGPLIISEFSGTASSLPDAIQINPWDLSRVADKIHDALTMSEEQRKKMHDSIFEHVKRYNVAYWTNSILRRLAGILDARKSTVSGPLTSRSRAPLKASL